MNQQIECYLNKTINLRPLTSHIHVIPTKWRSCRGRRFCDVTSPLLRLPYLTLPSYSSPAKYHAVSVDGRNQIVSRCMVAVVAHTDIDCALRIVVNCCV